MKTLTYILRINICLINASNMRLKGHIADGKIRMTGNECTQDNVYEDEYAEAEIISGDNDDQFIVKFLKSTVPYVKDGTEIDFFRL